ncbi:MAG: DUF1697 domain-containing protein [Myxococcales bacterium]|nr:DUF1697 domain-containing protein [Myxococcales bacterium]
MRRLILLLRAINVGGTNVLPMARLRALLEGLGYSSVATYLLLRCKPLDTARRARRGKRATALRSNGQQKRVTRKGKRAQPFSKLVLARNPLKSRERGMQRLRSGRFASQRWRGCLTPPAQREGQIPRHWARHVTPPERQCGRLY